MLWCATSCWSGGCRSGPSSGALSFLGVADGPQTRNLSAGDFASCPVRCRSSANRELVTAQHFFKAGEQRAQAHAMLLSLAHQLAERLPGFAAQLRPVVEKHGASTGLPLVDTFERYLLKPLQDLEVSAATETGTAMPWVLLLIDALDEADDGRGHWLPVAVLLNKE